MSFVKCKHCLHKHIMNGVHTVSAKGRIVLLPAV